MNVLVFHNAYLWAFVVTFLLVNAHGALYVVPFLPCIRFSFGLIQLCAYSKILPLCTYYYVHSSVFYKVA
jgi:hypothetical protein